MPSFDEVLATAQKKGVTIMRPKIERQEHESRPWKQHMHENGLYNEAPQTEAKTKGDDFTVLEEKIKNNAIQSKKIEGEGITFSKGIRPSDYNFVDMNASLPKEDKEEALIAESNSPITKEKTIKSNPTLAQTSIAGKKKFENAPLTNKTILTMLEYTDALRKLNSDQEKILAVICKETNNGKITDVRIPRRVFNDQRIQMNKLVQNCDDLKNMGLINHKKETIKNKEHTAFSFIVSLTS